MCRRISIHLIAALTFVSVSASAQDVDFGVDPAQSSIRFTLSDVLHTVHGTFRVMQGHVQLSPGGKTSGKIVIDATSGQSGNSIRDRKMHKEVLESARYPEISFRPDHIEGPAASTGKANVVVHGVFLIHGTEREITVPASLDISGDHWSGNAHFTVPYANWGMKNPSTLFLRVSDSVEIDLALSGSISRKSAASIQKPF